MWSMMIIEQLSRVDRYQLKSLSFWFLFGLRFKQANSDAE